MLKIINQLPEKQLLVFLLIIGFLTRLLFFTTYFGVTIYGDSTDYIRLTKTITNLDLTQFEGRRTPGYSIIIAALQNKLSYVVVFQSLLGRLFDVTTISVWIFWVHLPNLFVERDTHLPHRKTVFPYRSSAKAHE